MASRDSAPSARRCNAVGKTLVARDVRARSIAWPDVQAGAKKVGAAPVFTK